MPQWLQEILLGFVSAGYTNEKMGEMANPIMTAVTREMLKARLSSCLTHTLGTQIDEDSVLPAMVAKAIAGINPEENEVWSQADPAVQETIEHGLGVISKLDSKVSSLHTYDRITENSADKFDTGPRSSRYQCIHSSRSEIAPLCFSHPGLQRRNRRPGNAQRAARLLQDYYFLQRD